MASHLHTSVHLSRGPDPTAASSAAASYPLAYIQLRVNTCITLKTSRSPLPWILPPGELELHWDTTSSLQPACLPLSILLWPPQLKYVSATLHCNGFTYLSLRLSCKFLKNKAKPGLLSLVLNKVTSIKQELHNHCWIIKWFLTAPENRNRKKNRRLGEQTWWSG